MTAHVVSVQQERKIDDQRQRQRYQQVDDDYSMLSGLFHGFPAI